MAENIENIYKEDSKEDIEERFTKAFVKFIVQAEETAKQDALNLQCDRNRL